VATASAYLTRVRESLWSRDMFAFIPDRDFPPPEGAVTSGGGPRVVFAGFPSDYSLGFLLDLLLLDVQLVGIVTSPGAHPAILGDNALSRVADHLGIPLVRAWRINDEHSRLALSQLEPDAAVMASFDQIVGPGALAIPRHGWMNIHPSLIPAYRGPEPVYWAIAEGAETTGITLHRAVAKVDSGPILAQAALAIHPDDTSGTLTRRLVASGLGLLPGALTGLLTDAPGVMPDMSKSSYRGSVGHRPLQTAATAVEAERMVRAGVPNMPAWAAADGDVMYVIKARVVTEPAKAEGVVLAYPDGGLELLETSPLCGCHHNTRDCPHRERLVANVSASEGY
jgi:methionyl-tRNA formyltransferase